MIFVVRNIASFYLFIFMAIDIEKICSNKEKFFWHLVKEAAEGPSNNIWYYCNVCEITTNISIPTFVCFWFILCWCDVKVSYQKKNFSSKGAKTILVTIILILWLHLIIQPKESATLKRVVSYFRYLCYLLERKNFMIISLLDEP